MTTTGSREREHTHEETRPARGRRGDWIALALGLWLMVGLIFDFMAHNAGTQDPLFSSSHLMLAVGVGAVAAWLAWGVWHRVGAGRHEWATIPAGDNGVLIALVLFVITFGADPLWHVLRGFEKGILALTSPSHAPFFVGVALLLSTPFRTAWRTADADPAGAAPSLRAFLPVILSLSLTMAFVALTFTHVWPFFLDTHILDSQVREALGPVAAAGGYPAAVLREVVLRRFLNGIYLGNLMLFPPLLLLLRRWRPPFGTATIYMLVVAGAFSLPTALAAGIVTDGLIRLLQPSPDRLGALRLFAAAAPVATWSLYLLTVHARWGLALPLEGWGGAIVWSGVGGLVLSLIMVPPRVA